MTLREKAVLAEKAARASGEMLLSHPRTAGCHKAENDFVTEMDIKSEELIRSILLGACPEDGFFGEEEGGNETAEGRWIVDPIDGTSNFMKGEINYTVSIAYELQGELVVGCVYCPPTDEMFIGVKGEGATRNGVPIHVSEESVPRNSFVHISFCHRHPHANIYMAERLTVMSRTYSDLRRLGSAAYDLCCVADGRCEGYAEPKLNIYDIAGGVMILREAGGTVTDLRPGRDVLKNCDIVATNGKIHDHLLNLLREGDLSLLDEDN